MAASFTRRRIRELDSIAACASKSTYTADPREVFKLRCCGGSSPSKSSAGDVPNGSASEREAPNGSAVIFLHSPASRRPTIGFFLCQLLLDGKDFSRRDSVLRPKPVIGAAGSMKRSPDKVGLGSQERREL